MLSKLAHSRSFASKSVIHGARARAAMLAGCNQLADAVQVTMGPKGRNVVIDQAFGPPKVTKDGVTVAKAIEIQDRTQNLGAALVKQVASRTNDQAGDGTTTATVLARAIFREGCKAVAAGMNPMDLKRGIDMAVRAVLVDLKSSAKPITSKDEIEQVATIASNGDKEVGSLLAEAFGRVGKEGTITVQDGKTMEHTLEVVEGMKFDRGFISPYFINNPKTQRVELKNPLVLLHEKKISTIQPLLPLLEQAMKTQRPLLIIAEDVDGDALATLVLNKLRGGLDVTAVKAPGFGDHRKAMMVDLAILTGGQLIAEDTGAKLEEVTLQQLGSCKQVTITKDDTVLMDGGGAAAELSERCDTLRELIETNTSTYETDKLKERLAKLSGGVAVIKVGGSSEVAVSEVKDRIEDALCATRAAVEQGIVPGGGVALLNASKRLEAETKPKNFDQKHGVDIIREAIRIPLRTIVDNAGEDGVVVVQALLREESATRGYNAQTGQYVEMIDTGIIDPTKVVRTALSDAASVASLMTTTETTITDLMEEKEEKKKVSYADF